MVEVKGTDISFIIRIFPDHTEPVGRLPRAVEAQALWWFYLVAHKRLETVRKNIEDHTIVMPEGASDSEYPWPSTHFEEQLRAIAMQYNVTPVEMARFWPAVREEAKRCGLPDPEGAYVNIQPRNH